MPVGDVALEMAAKLAPALNPVTRNSRRNTAKDAAFRILREGHNALEWIGEFVAEENIDCDFERVGRFYGAHRPSEYEKLGAKITDLPKELDANAYLVPKAEQHSEIETDAYHGGLVSVRHASVDPARFHHGLMDRATQAGVRVYGHWPVVELTAENGGYTVTSPRGSFWARDVVVATSGYTGKLTPWLQRRIIPIGSYIIATEPLAPEVMARLMPKARVITDTRKLVYYYRCSPDRRRILFGGRVSLKETDPRVSAGPLRAEVERLFPELKGIKVTHSWMGFVGYTFDEMPHLGRHEGVHYAMGYCGSGVSLASYFGTRLGQQVVGLSEGKTAIDNLDFPTRLYYRGNPWFLAPSIRYYRWRDGSAS